MALPRKFANVPKELLEQLALKELIRRRAERDPGNVLDPNYPEQNAFVIDTSRMIAAQTTRRAGKSTGLAKRFIRTMQRYPNCFCPYIALTRQSAENIMWGILQEEDEKYKIGAHFAVSDLTMTMPNGARLQLFGADMKNFIKRLRGIKTPGAAIDEAQDFGSHVESLVDDVLGPALLDYTDGWLALVGTPGPVPTGFFYDVTAKGMDGFSVHKWSLFDNPYLPNPRKFVEELKRRKNWDDHNPTLRREYLGEWVLDLEALVIKYVPEVNHYDDLPDREDQWAYVLSIDIGFDDADALAVIGWHKHEKAAYLIEEIVQTQQGITELAHVIERLMRKYDPDKIVMDTGGLGKKIAEEMRRRYSLPIVSAEKTRKIEYIELFNDALRTRKFFAKKDTRFAQDSMKLKWDYDKSTPDKLVISDSFHSDSIDAVLYGYRESLHWHFEPEVIKPKPGAKDWYLRQAEEMENELLNQFERSKDDWGY